MTPNPSTVSTVIPVPSLPEVYRSIEIPKSGAPWRRFFAFLGPGYLVSVGYMDPGNWATDIAGGSKFGYTLLSVILISNLMAILLQALCVRLGVATGRDLAQAAAITTRSLWRNPVDPLRIAIIACDSRRAARQRPRVNFCSVFRWRSRVPDDASTCCVAAVAAEQGLPLHRGNCRDLVDDDCDLFRAQVLMSRPDWIGVRAGSCRHAQVLANPEMLYIAMGILARR